MKASLLALALLGAGCRTIETRSASSAPPAVRLGQRTRVWDVRRGEELLGQVILFQERGRCRDSVYFVRNPWSQDLGMIDGLGRAFRYLPHSEEPAWVGSGTIAQGAERILGASDLRLVEHDSALVAPHSGQTDGETFPHADLEPTARPSNAPIAAGGLPQSR
jgi:hypothetical protein